MSRYIRSKQLLTFFFCNLLCYFTSSNSLNYFLLQNWLFPKALVLFSLNNLLQSFLRNIFLHIKRIRRVCVRWFGKVQFALKSFFSVKIEKIDFFVFKRANLKLNYLGFGECKMGQAASKELLFVFLSV